MQDMSNIKHHMYEFVEQYSIRALLQGHIIHEKYKISISRLSKFANFEKLTNVGTWANFDKILIMYWRRDYPCLRFFQFGALRRRNFCTRVDLKKCCKISIRLQKSVSIQPGTSRPNSYFVLGVILQSLIHRILKSCYNTFCPSMPLQNDPCNNFEGSRVKEYKKTQKNT